MISHICYFHTPHIQNDNCNQLIVSIVLSEKFLLRSRQRQGEHVRDAVHLSLPHQPAGTVGRSEDVDESRVAEVVSNVGDVQLERHCQTNRLPS